jgi:hypothetical protein
MKHLIFLVLIIIPIFSFGQNIIEVKTKPLSFFLGSLGISSEFHVKEKFSIEPDLTFNLVSFSQFENFNNKGFIFSLQGKFYCIPKSNGDKLYLGLYTKYKSIQDFRFNNIVRNEAAIGIMLGYKWLLSNRIVLQVDAGFGRQIYEASYLDDLLQSEISLPSQDIFQFTRNSDLFINFKTGYRFITK